MAYIQSITLAQSQVTASAQVADLAITINGQTTPHPIMVRYTIENKPVGSITLTDGLTQENQTVNLSVNLSGFKNGTLALNLVAQVWQNNAFEDDHQETLSLEADGIIPQPWLKEDPLLEFSPISPALTDQALPIIRFSLDKKLRDGKKQVAFATYGVNEKLHFKVTLNGEDHSEQLLFDGVQFTLLPKSALQEGENLLHLSVIPEAFPYMSYTHLYTLILDTQPPEIQFAESQTFSKELNPVIRLKLRDGSSGLNTEKLALKINGSVVDFTLLEINRFSDSEYQEFELFVKDTLWEGQHQVEVQATDQIGNTSAWTPHQLFVDTIAPSVKSVSPANEAMVGAQPGNFTFNLTDQPLPAISRLPIEYILGVGGLSLHHLQRAGIHQIVDLLKRNPSNDRVPGMSQLELLRAHERAQLITSLGISANVYQGLLFKTVEDIIQQEASNLQTHTTASLEDILQLKKDLAPLYLSLDRKIFRKIKLGQCATVQGSGLASVTLTLDGQIISAGVSQIDQQVIWSPVEALSAGRHHLRLNYNDVCGNSGHYDHWFTVDVEPPSIQLISPIPDSYVNQNTAELQFAYQDAAGVNPGSVSIWCNELNITAQASIRASEASIVTNGFNTGANVVKIQVADNLDNATEQSFTFYYDGVAPTLTLTNALDLLATARSQVTLIGETSTDAVTLQVNGQSVAINDGAFQVNVAVNDGQNLLRLKTIDEANNESAEYQLAVFKVNTQQTALYGQLLDINDAPIVGATIQIKATQSLTTSDSRGYFCLKSQTLRAGQNQLEVLPPQSRTNDLQSFQVQVALKYGQVTHLGQRYLLPKSEPNGIAIDSQQSITTLTEASTELSVYLPNQHLALPEGTQKVAVTALDAQKMPVRLPEGIVADKVWSLEPSGTQIKNGRGADFQMKNFMALEADSLVPFLLYNEADGQWEMGPVGKVSADGQTIQNIDNAGIAHFSILAAIPPNVRLEVADEAVHIPGADALKGGAEINIALPSFEYLGNEQKPILSYNSLAAAPTVVITGVFKGLETFTEVEKLPPVNINDTQTLWRSQVHVEARQYRNNRVLGIGNRRKHVGTTTQSLEEYIPVGSNPYQNLPKRKDLSKKDWIEYTYQVINTPVEVYRFSKRVFQNLENELWPRSITSKYYLGYIETLWQTLLGTPTTKQAGNETKDTYVLPPDLAVVQVMEPKFADGSYYPTGVYAFIGKYKVGYEGYQVETTSSIVDDYAADPGFLNYLHKKKQELEAKGSLSAEEQRTLLDLRTTIDNLLTLKRQHDDGDLITDNVQTEWLAPIDVLNQRQAGQVIVHNLANSALGRGWYFNQLQRVYPAGSHRALLIEGNQKMVFTMDQIPIEKVMDLPNAANDSIQCFELYPDQLALAVVIGNQVEKWDIPSGHKEILYTFDTYENGYQLLKLKKKLEPETRTFTCNQLELQCNWTSNFLLDDSRSNFTPILPDGDFSTGNVIPVRECIEVMVERTCTEVKFVWKGQWDTINDSGAQKSLSIYQTQINSMAIAPDGNIYLADSGTHQILCLAPDKTLTQVCGTFREERSEKEIKLIPNLNLLKEIDDIGEGNLGQPIEPGGEAAGTPLWPRNPIQKIQVETYTDDQKTIHKEWEWKVETTYAGDQAKASTATLYHPCALSISPEGDLIFSENGHNVIRHLDLQNDQLSRIAGRVTVSDADAGYDPAEVNALTASLPNAIDTCVDAAGNTFALLRIFENQKVSDVVVKIDPTQKVSLVAGNPNGTLATGIDATMHKIVDATGIEIDAQGVLYILESNQLVQVQQGFVDELAGGSNGSTSGDGGAALNAVIGKDSLMKLHPDGGVWVLDVQFQSLRQVALSVVLDATIEMAGPVGYTESRLYKQTNGGWVRKYQDGSKAIFDRNGLITQWTDARDRRITYAYQGENIQKISYDLGQYLEFQYNAAGKLTQITDHLGRVTQLTVNEQDLTQIHLPDARTYSFEYYEDGKIKTQREN